MLKRTIAVVCGLLLMMRATAAAEDRDFPEPHNNERNATAEPMPAAEAAATMRVPEGFGVQLFAAEPEVQNPIDMAWDARGRLWIAENYTYSDRSERFDLSLRDRVVVLEDRDGDGVSDRRTVFVDTVQMLTSVAVGHDGVWLMCPPQLLFIPDADHDAVPDSDAVRVVLDGFTVAEQNYHNFANGLRFGPDGWLYGRCGGSCPGRIGPPGTPDDQRAALEGGLWRYHPRSGQYEVLTHGTTNPWGHDWNAYGEGFYINTVNGHFWHLIPGAHYRRPSTLDPNPSTYELIDTHADHWHFDTSGHWTDSRDGAANEFGGGHAHCGMMIYLGDQWPEEYRGALLTINLHGRRANREILHRRGSGYVASHGEDFLLSEDPFFRGMELSYGPDGSVLLIDWSDTGECHDHTGVHRTSGRVFRIRHEASQHPRAANPPPNLYELAPSALVDLQQHDNEWFVRQSRLELAARAAVEPLSREQRERLERWAGGSDGLLACRALWTLNAAGGVAPERLFDALGHADPHVRVCAIRLLSEHWPIDDCYGPLDTAIAPRPVAERTLAALLRTARSDRSALVRLALASTLQRLPVDERLPLATALVQHAEDSEDHNLPLLVWYGLMPVAQADPAGLAQFALACRWPQTQRLAARRLTEGINEWPEAVDALVAGSIAPKISPAVRRNLLAGMADGLRGWLRAPQPDSWPELVARLQREADADALRLVRELEVIFGDGRAITELRELVLDDAADIGLRRSALGTLVANRSPGLREICLPLLSDARVNVVAAQGLAQLEDPEVAAALLKHYRRFRAPQRPKVIAILCSRADWARQLLEAVEQGDMPATALTAYDVRQIRTMDDAQLNAALEKLWGNVRDTPAEKVARVEALRETLQPERLAEADLAAGRRLFQTSCQQCHRLYGQGEQVGPELTGANRGNLDYLLENIVDPSAVVSKDFRMTVLLLEDGRVINGLVTTENARTITLQTQRDRLVIDKETVAQRKRTSQSPMPEGLLDNLTEAQIRDLFAYLMHPTQVSLAE